MLVAILLLLGGFWYLKKDVSPAVQAVQSNDQALSNVQIPRPVEIILPVKEEIMIPDNHFLAVPFTAQAPTANWDELHNEACEEASAIMAWSYFSGDQRAVLPAKEVEAEIKKLTDWQQKNFGYYLDATLEETGQMLREVYNLKTEMIAEATEAAIKEALTQNRLVILAVDGRKIGNPNYKAPGPKYHMLVIRGYEDGEVITNDSGTRKGQGYRYSFKTLLDATADWDHATDDIDPQFNAMLVVYK